MYESFFGLTGKPFQLNPDPDFFYGSDGHRRAIAFLEYGLHQGEGFIVITGEVGAGKTTVVRSLLRTLPARNIVPAQILSTQVDADDLLKLVAAAFDVRTTDHSKAALLNALEIHFRCLHDEGKRALLIVDEAQNLAPRAVEELRMLSNFQTGNQSLVQSFLVGQPEFREILQRPELRQLKQRVIASYHLGPLGRQETQRYIEHRLGHVGWSGNPHIDQGGFEKIFDLTQGVPRRVNTLCDRLLLNAYLSEQSTIAAADVESVAEELGTELGTIAPSEPRLPSVASLAAMPVGASGSGSVPMMELESTVAGLDARLMAVEAQLPLLTNRLTAAENFARALHRIMKNVMQALRMETTSSRGD